MEFIVENQGFFIIGLSAITLGLSVYLGFLLKKIKSQKSTQMSLLEEQRAEKKQREKYYRDSILIIAKSTIQGDCETSEACIRIKKLLEFFPMIASEDEFSIIQKLFEELDGLSYLDDRKKLSKTELNKQDLKRFKLEDEFRDRFIASLKILVTRFE